MPIAHTTAPAGVNSPPRACLSQNPDFVFRRIPLAFHLESLLKAQS